MNHLKGLFIYVLMAATVSCTFAISTATTGGSNVPELTPTESAIVIDPVTKKIYVTTGYFQNTGENSSGSITNDVGGTEVVETGDIVDVVTDITTEEGVVTETAEVPTTKEPTTNDQMTEYEQALAWMYANGLTKYSDPEEYRPQDYLTREESAKIIGQLYATLGYDQTAHNTTSCEFLDADKFDPSLTPHIQNVCARNLFKGYEGNYMPRQPLTRPQTMAVLMRMFEGKMSNESKTPRWGDYYLKGQAIGLIDEGNINEYDQEITRKEVALYAFRIKNIVVNEKLKTMSLNAIAQVESENNSSTSTNTDDSPEVIVQNLGTLANNINAGDDPELQEAVQRMYDNGLTMFPSVEEYSPFTTLSREGAAKILHIFAELFNLAESYDNYLPNECNFADIAHMDQTMQNHIQGVCKLGLMKGAEGKFRPSDDISKAQFVAALMRMFEGEHMDETVDPRRKNYFEKAQELGIVGPADAITFDGPITRYEVALFLYRFKVKYQMLKSLNSSKLQNEVVSSVEGSMMTGTNGLPESNVYVDINLIKDANFEIGYVETFGNRYKVVKTAVEKYDIPDSFVWYADLFDLVDDQKIGTISFIISNGLMIEGTMRITATDQRFAIQALPDTKAYFKIKEIKTQ